jgi:hypothetical protein
MQLMETNHASKKTIDDAKPATGLSNNQENGGLRQLAAGE